MPERAQAALVVGGGVAGLLAALLLKRRYASVTLVEKDLRCGGLFDSVETAGGVPFDYGTHLISDTGLPDLDALLYGWMNPQQWHTFQVIKTGNFFHGRMNRASALIDARCLGESEFRAGFAELLATTPFKPDDCGNLKDYLQRHLGPTFTRSIYAPALRKHLGVALEELHPGTPFVLKRLICADTEESRRLKKDPFLDTKIAFTSYAEGERAVNHRYPRSGGLGQWIRGLERKIAEAGVVTLTGRTVTAVQRQAGNATGVMLDDGRFLQCGALVWTIPPLFLLKAAGLSVSPAAVKIQPVGLYHFVFDRPFLDENYYITCYDESLRTFRVTLYPNVRDGPGKPPHNCTVEVIAEFGTNFEALKDTVLDELRSMGILAASAKLLSSETRIVPAGFPATTHAFMRAAAEQSELAARQLSNTLLLGRAKCPPFLTTDVLIEAYRKVTALTDEYQRI